ncbi:MAG: hypothetical protein II135_00855 [Clostridia bacterium]|jgi:hypothetical protein|nr:hypothetical protein [Clostridia bacterium]MBQ3870439.1 hypothetical protein [Clostridia bacterium]
MKIKEGTGWKAGYNEEKNVYGAETVFRGSWDLYEISAEVFSQLYDNMDGGAAEELIRTGRRVYAHCNDEFNPPYNIVLDDDYEIYCPWTAKNPVGKTWSAELTDAAVEVFASEEKNREKRRKKREQRNKKN